MNNNKFIWGAIAIVFIVAVIALFTGGSTIVKESTNNVPFLGGTTNYDNLTLGENLIVGGTASFTGALTSSDRAGTTIGPLVIERKAITVLASTTCSLTPPTASSTLLTSNLVFTSVGSTTSVGLGLATSTGPMASSTFLYGAGINVAGDDWVTRGGQDMFSFTPTTTAKQVFDGTKRYLNWYIFGGTSGNNGLNATGYCQAVWIKRD